MSTQIYLEYVMRSISTIIFNAQNESITKKQVVDGLKNLLKEYNQIMGKDIK